MDIKIGNEILKNHIVNFASINNIILISRDIINNGLFMNLINGFHTQSIFKSFLSILSILKIFQLFMGK